MNSLELFKQIIKSYTEMFNMSIHHPKDTIVKWEGVDEIEKSLKALGIIIKKNVNIYWLKLCALEKNGLEMYNARNNQELTNSEYDLLKEIYEQFKAI